MTTRERLEIPSPVVVTGGAGFLGRAVVEALERRGVGPVVVPRSARYDLVAPGAAERLLEDSGARTVIHLAAVVGGIGANRLEPGRFFYTNLMMGVQLMHAAMRAGTERFVSVGTVCSYPKTLPAPFQVESLWSGYPEETNAPYGLAKKMLLVMGQAYHQQYGMAATHLIPVNLYGPGDDFDLERGHVIPALLRKCVAATERGAAHIDVWGDGSPTREFLYVEDAAEAIALAAARYQDPAPLNLGSGVEIRIRDLAERVAAEVGFTGELRWDAARPNGQPRRLVDSRRAREVLGWRPEVSFDEGLRRTVAWFRAHRGDR